LTINRLHGVISQKMVLCIRDVLGLNLSRDTAYPVSDFSWFSSAPPGKFQRGTVSRQVPSKSFPIHISRSSKHSTLLRSPLNKLQIGVHANSASRHRLDGSEPAESNRAAQGRHDATDALLQAEPLVQDVMGQKANIPLYSFEIYLHSLKLPFAREPRNFRRSTVRSYYILI
jgi:hypothetical protein